MAGISPFPWISADLDADRHAKGGGRVEAVYRDSFGFVVGKAARLQVRTWSAPIW